MKRLIVICILACAAGFAGASVVNFDDLATPLNSGGMLYGAMPLNYEGFTWEPENVQSSWNVNDASKYDSVYGNSVGAVSGNVFASNSGGALLTVSGPVFDFVGVFITGWEQGNAFKSWSAKSVTAKGYREGSLVGEKTLTFSGNGYDWLEANFAGVDTVEFSTSAGKYWIMDDFTTVAAVPEPATMAIFALGGVLLRKRG